MFCRCVICKLFPNNVLSSKAQNSEKHCQRNITQYGYFQLSDTKQNVLYCQNVSKGNILPNIVLNIIIKPGIPSIIRPNVCKVSAVMLSVMVPL